MKSYIVLGSGAFAREVYWHILGSAEQRQLCKIVFLDPFADFERVLFGSDKEVAVAKCESSIFAAISGSHLRGFLVGIGSPDIKKRAVEHAISIGIKPADTIVHSKAFLQANDISVGYGGVICPGVIVTTNVQIEDYVVLNLNSTIGHDCKIGRFVTCNPGSQISGGVEIGDSVVIGVGACVKEYTKIAAHTIVGAQAFVSRDITEPGTYVGIPARRITKLE